MVEGENLSYDDFEEMNLKEFKLKDLQTLKIYNSMPKEFKEALSFKDFYPIALKRLFELEGVYGELIEEEEDEETEDDLTEPTIIEERLCKRCKRNAKSYGDKDFCWECIDNLTAEAKIKQEEIAKELSEDSEFKKLSSEIKAQVYVKKKYEEEENKNKFIHLKTLGKEEYYKNKI
jgi:hypothetical protein